MARGLAVVVVVVVEHYLVTSGKGLPQPRKLSSVIPTPCRAPGRVAAALYITKERISSFVAEQQQNNSSIVAVSCRYSTLTRTCHTTVKHISQTTKNTKRKV